MNICICTKFGKLVRRHNTYPTIRETFYPERSRSIREDAVKWTLIIPKIILQNLSLWPEIQTLPTRVLSCCLLMNITILFVPHIAYFMENIHDVVKMAELLTTVNVLVQTYVRVTTLLRRKDELRSLVSKVWHEFWPSNVLTPTENWKLKKTTVRYFAVISIYLMADVGSCVQFMYQPLVLGIRNLPLMLKLPFSYMGSPTFELLYVWICITCLGIIVFALIGFDLLFTMLTWNCTMQFKILRILLTRVVRENGAADVDEDIEERKRRQQEETNRLLSYIQHHNKLIVMCDEMEELFKFVSLVQLLDSAIAICFCNFAAVTVPQLFAKMMTFSLMYFMQLFLYCAFGNELLHQSTTLSYAAFSCGWHNSDNMEVRKSIIMMMQKSQRGQCLTARGFAVLNYASCAQVVKMAFSFFTVLDAMKRKKEL